MYKAVKITRGSGGWGGPLVVKADSKRNKILSVTGGGIHPVAAKLAEMTGGVAVDGFKGGARTKKSWSRLSTAAAPHAAASIRRKRSSPST